MNAMDLNDLRGLTTVLSMLVFLGIVAWAYAGKNRERFDEAARLPFTESEDEQPAKPERH